MKPTRPRDDAVVDLLDVLLRDGVVLSADVVVTVADVPLVGIKLRAAIAGMATMTDHGMLTDLDRRARGVAGRPGVAAEGPDRKRERGQGRERDGGADGEGGGADDEGGAAVDEWSSDRAVELEE